MNAPLRNKPEVTEAGAVKVRRALLSASDRRGLLEFASGLQQLGVEILSTGGTGAALTKGGVAVRAVEDFTGFPEMMDGRVKTLHPRIHAGLLAVRSDQNHVEALIENDMETIDLVCVNLYPFEQTARRKGIPANDVIEQIDIGGPSMIRSAAKNFAFTAIVVSPESYDAVLEELRESDGMLSMATREQLAADAFSYTARYDAAISRWFNERSATQPDHYVRAYEKVFDLPYGENPHQTAAYYTEVGARSDLLAKVAQLQGKELSYNNLLDLDSGRRLLDEFQRPACAILKHNNPCGAAAADSACEAYEKALATDPLSAFGGIYCFNSAVDAKLAEEIIENFVELVFAPDYSGRALAVFERKPNIRVLQDSERRAWPDIEPQVRGVRGGILLQDRDSLVQDQSSMEVVTKAQPSDEQWEALLFAWAVCKHVRSNAIVLGSGTATISIGAGQMSRVDSVKIAIEKARRPLQGTAMASDAFFPFADGPQLAIDAGITSIIQPGGSKRDDEVITACDAAGIAMVFTKHRHFRH